MSRQEPLTRTNDPETSHAAAADAKPSVPMLRSLILRELTRREPLGGTTEEVATSLGIPLGSITPRFAPMERDGLIVRTDERRAGASGSKRIVWRLSPQVQR